MALNTQLQQYGTFFSQLHVNAKGLFQINETTLFIKFEKKY